MATFIEPGFLANFSFLFTFLLVFVLLFALLETKKVLKTSSGINAIIAFCLAFIVTLSRTARDTITIAAPWFVALFFFLFFILLAYSIFGAGEKEFGVALKDTRVINWIIALSILIIVVALSGSIGQNLLSARTGETIPGDVLAGANATNTNTTNFGTNVVATITHPNVLGLIILLIIASFTIRQLAQED